MNPNPPIPTPPSAQELRELACAVMEQDLEVYDSVSRSAKILAQLCREKAEALERGAETRAGGQNGLAWLESGKDSLPDRDLIDILAAKLAAERALSDRLAKELGVIRDREPRASMSEKEEMWMNAGEALAVHAEARKQP